MEQKPKSYFGLMYVVLVAIIAASCFSFAFWITRDNPEVVFLDRTFSQPADPIKKCLRLEVCYVIISPTGVVAVIATYCEDSTLKQLEKALPANLLKTPMPCAREVSESVFASGVKIRYPDTGLYILKDGFYENTRLGLIKLN